MVAAAPAPVPAPEFSLFTKHLVGLPYHQLAAVVAELGFKGVEAPVRKGGHVEPARVEEDLPKLVEAFRQQGVAITQITTDINSINAADRTETVLRTARGLGVERFRMKWYAYAGEKSHWDQLDEIKPKLHDLIAFSREIRILPCYQNHSGSHYVGAGIWDLALLMKDYRRDEFAWSFDFFHAMVEGGLSWPNEFALIKDHLAMPYFKNFTWKGRLPVGCPLAEGNVGKSAVDLLKAAQFNGPVCLHVEYLEGSIKAPGALEKAVAATRLDLATLKSWYT